MGKALTETIKPSRRLRIITSADNYYPLPQGSVPCPERVN
jgi:hypothetical protein